jgi:uncharacterized protein
MAVDSSRNSLSEPAPIWSEQHRLCGERALPPYRFVSGLNPHPVRHPDGHSHGVSEDYVLLHPGRWMDSMEYLYGIDLYHHAYFWEAHEEWEGLWKLAERGSQRLYLQALIKLSVAQLKLSWGSVEGGRKLSASSAELLRTVLETLPQEAESRFMGIYLPDLLAGIEAYWKSIWDGGGRTVRARTGFVHDADI